jgi:uncharacterized protein YkwD
MKPQNDRRKANPTPEEVADAIVAGINAERRKRNLKPLREESKLTRAARGHSEAMVRNDFFNHTDKQGRGPAERVSALGYRWRAVAENIAMNAGYGDPAKQAVEGWLKSPGHRANLLSPEFTETGVGVAFRPGGPGGGRWYFTQVFGRPM